MTIYNMGEGGAVGTGYAHPIHIHGTHYYLMKVGYPTYDLNGMVKESNPDIPCSREQVEYMKRVISLDIVGTRSTVSLIFRKRLGVIATICDGQTHRGRMGVSHT